MIFLMNGRSFPIYLCDLSLGGLGFNIAPQYVRNISCGQDISIKYRSLSGVSVQRKVRIKSIDNNRVGAEFIDRHRPAASW